MASTFNLLQRAEKLELVAADLYLALSERYPGEAGALFARLAREEGQHAARIRLLAARYQHDSRLIATHRVDMQEIEALVVEAGASLAAILRGEWDGDRDGTIRRVADMEARFCKAHAHALPRDAHPELLAFFEQLSTQDEAHRLLLVG
jgi:rubrerythrin